MYIAFLNSAAKFIPDIGLHHSSPDILHAGSLLHHLRPQHSPPAQLRDHANAAQGAGMILCTRLQDAISGAKYFITFTELNCVNKILLL